MTSNQERAKQLMADSRFAFMNGQNREALNLAKEAIQLASKDPDAYQCAANACMSLGDYDNAIDYYKKAVKLDTGNGNRYFNLGYAYASAEKAGEAVKNLAKAEELGCTPENTVQLTWNRGKYSTFEIERRPALDHSRQRREASGAWERVNDKPYILPAEKSSLAAQVEAR